MGAQVFLEPRDLRAELARWADFLTRVANGEHGETSWQDEARALLDASDFR